MEENNQNSISDAVPTEPTDKQSIQAADQLTEPPPKVMVYKLRSGYDLHLKMEINAGDVLVSTLLVFLIITILVVYLHKLILGGKGRG